MKSRPCVFEKLNLMFAYSYLVLDIYSYNLFKLKTSNRIMILVKMVSAWSLSKSILTGLRSWRRLPKPIVAEIWCFINTERLGHVLYVGCGHCEHY